MHSVLATVFLSSEFWNSTIHITTPIAFCALACLICSRAGVLFVGVEGVLLFSAFFAIAGTVWTSSIALGVLFAVGAGIVGALAFGLLSMQMRMGDVIGGLVIYIGALGLSAFLSAQIFPNGQTIGARALGPIWGSVGGSVGAVLFHQQPLVYLAIVATIAIALFLPTRWGLRLRSSGESVPVARSFGVNVVHIRYGALTVAGALVGLGGATIGLAIVGTFDTNIVNGQGFVGLACVMLGAWRPVGALLASLLFGAAYALQFHVQTLGGWIQILPYAITLLAIALFWGRAQGPAEEGKGITQI